MERRVAGPVWAAGLMSGTSMDGVDAAAIRTDGYSITAFGPTAFAPFSPAETAAIKAAIQRANQSLSDADDLCFRMHGEPDAIWLDNDFYPVFEALNRAYPLAIQMLGADEVRVIGAHGQTIAHRPQEALSLQIFNPYELLEFAEVPVVWDFRRSDILAGGEGAPLAPFFHFALAKYIGATTPIAFLNIGGVANVTWVDPARNAPTCPGALVAFDTGPGNALINDWTEAQIGEALDRDGDAAAAGRVHPDRMATNSGQAYLDRRPPKSLDRNDFHGVLAAVSGLSVEDGAATLTAFTADCVAASVAHMPSPPTRWLVCGGGRHNRTMMAMLAERLEAPVDPVEAVGLDGDMLEAQAFAYLAVRVLRGLPTSAPSTTGCREPVCGGRISYP